MKQYGFKNSSVASLSVPFRWLVVKNWLVQKKKKLELAPKRTWKKYWVCLKGTVLLFYDGDIDNVTLDDNVPRHMLGKWKQRLCVGGTIGLSFLIIVGVTAVVILE